VRFIHVRRFDALPLQEAPQAGKTSYRCGTQYSATSTEFHNGFPVCVSLIGHINIWDNSRKVVCLHFCECVLFFRRDGNDTLINTSTNNGLVNYLHGGEDHNRIVTGVGTDPFIFNN
jgi:hypothetical protein